jgi:hypothetical protein
MRRALKAIVLVACAAAAERDARADGPEMGFDYLSGGRARSGTPDSLLFGGEAFLGYGWTAGGFGVDAHLLGSPPFGTAAVELGPYGYLNLVHIRLAPNLVLAVFTKVEALGRTATAIDSKGAFVPYVTGGLRVFGVELAAGGGLEVGNGPVGGDLVWKLGVDLCDFAHFVRSLNAGNTVPPP